MLKWILFSVLSLNLYALELSLLVAKENFKDYSIINIKEKKKFLCQDVKNEFDIVTKIVCVFSTSPSQKIKPLQNAFFKIDTKIKKDSYFIIITPLKKSKLYPVVFNLSEDNSVYAIDAKLSNRWMIVGYEKDMPFVKKKENSHKAINFPFYLDSHNMPFVGSLDLKGNPVYIKQVGDVSDFIRIKRYFEAKKYKKCSELVDDVMSEYPDSLFKAELIYYKIKASTKLNDIDNVMELSKIYLREYSSDENIAEVLALAARAYSLNGMNGQADYLFDRLFNEHEESEFAKWGYIYKGELFESTGAFTKAIKYYKKALTDTQDIDIAVTAAYKLAKYKVNNSKAKEASSYIKKIIDAKPNFFALNYDESFVLMQVFADEGEYQSGVYIAKSILENMDKIEDYEIILKNKALWLSKTAHKKEALKAINEYLKIYADGIFTQEVQVAKDGLFFDTSDTNLSAKLEEYDILIDTYSEDSIGNRAIYEKAKLLLENKMYGDILEFRDALLNLDESVYGDIKEMLEKAAKGGMKEALQNKQCNKVLQISSEFSIVLSDKWDDGIYECAMRGADFELAKNITLKNMKVKDIKLRKKWLYRYIKIDFETGNYSDVIKASKELITLIEDDKTKKYDDIYRVLFDTYQRVENSDKMIESMLKVQETFGVDYKDIERYIAVMYIGSQRDDDNIVIEYATKVMQIQKSSSSNAQSPFVEFTLYQAYISKDDKIQALKTIESLDKVELKKSDRARQKYLLGSVYEKLWRDEQAKKAYQEAIDADSSSAWAKLAGSAMSQ